MSLTNPNTKEQSDAIIVKEVTTKRELRRFVQFGIDLYKGNTCYCPPIILDELNTFKKGGNPALELSIWHIAMTRL